MDRRVKIKPTVDLGILVRTADGKKFLSKVDTTNWSYRLFTIAEFINDNMPSYSLNILPERYIEKFLRTSEIILK